MRLAWAAAFMLVLAFGLAFGVGAFAGWQYGSRDKVCVVMQNGPVQIPVCDYGFRPPKEAMYQ